MIRRGTRLVPLVPLVPLVVLAACSSPPRTRVVVMSGSRFTSAVDTVAVGDTVVWKNDDLVPHTATADDGTFSSGQVDVGRSWRAPAPAAGTHPYRCLYHTGMRATLVVR